MKSIPSLFVLISYVLMVRSQFRNTTYQYKQTIASEEKKLQEQIESHPDVNLFFNPDRALISANSYYFDYPLSADYRIGLIVDPCRFNVYNCCMNVFGTPEYPSLLKSNLEAERTFKYNVIADENDVSSNYFLVYEEGGSVASSARRSADDDAVHNTSCISKGNPYSFCQGRNYASRRSTLRPACMDNNSTLDVLAGCYDTNGTYSKHCVQIGFTSNTFIPLCKNNDCGTFLEIHMAHGTPYQEENVIIAEKEILQRNVSGYYTTTLPLTWMGNTSKVLCAYSESVYRIGTLVYIQPSAPVCCCPPPFQSTTRVGSFQCPKGAFGAVGSNAAVVTTVAEKLSVDSLTEDYPFCAHDLTANIDAMMCSNYHVASRRHFTAPCKNVTRDLNLVALKETRTYYSSDMLGKYHGFCPYYEGCALTVDAGKCQFTDLRFTFIGQVGMITALDNVAVIPTAMVSFNNGRTSYKFNQEDIKLETNTKSMYEIWWVVRSKSQYTVQKRKGFNVTSPTCTFDTTNNRYLPYTILNGTGFPSVVSVSQ